jgi:inosine-uridine nucleoside N-ribohydrolase
MLRYLQIFALTVLLTGPLSAQTVEPVRLILDTDIGNDVDDALALAMIHALENRGEVHLLAVTITKDNRYAAPFVDLVDNYYGRPGIPIGMVHHGKTPDDAAMLKVPAEKRDTSGHYLYPHTITDGSQAPDAVDLLKQVLMGQPDASVTIAQIGFSTNLNRLLESPGGQALVKRKVKLLSVMAGNFEKPQAEFNVVTDAPAAKSLFKTWPTPIIFSGFEIGLKITFPYQAIAKDFAWTANNPVVDAYNLYVGKPEDHPNWDSTAVLYAIRPDRGYFDLSQSGDVTLGPKHITVFTPDAAGNCRYLLLKTDQVERIRTVIEDLVSEPPQHAPVASQSHKVVF